ncbi:putative transmembrane protein [Gregarina niphandrodes]|uniref:Transmembrane protein n=1 Tax=Gregarina niphandrodes TaxID=110365 RepID=A0A023B0N1_GRENI|nr:putative transmembrane protein [Gregarina niphandrodes]EZG45471.1 putative transmembrane protein [Gregarina niphandrodes]|eukprot:XP_011132489.1 putative transmembrane protein [Gregarina niphandrodes]
MKFWALLGVWSAAAAAAAAVSVATAASKPGVHELEIKEGDNLSSLNRRKAAGIKPRATRLKPAASLPITDNEGTTTDSDIEEEYVVGPVESKIARFFGFDLEADDQAGERDVQQLASTPTTCASYKKCTKCVDVDVCNWCDATSTCHANSDPDPKCLTKKQWISSKWKCPGHLRWWGVLLICLACVCCCPLISALCFFFVIKKFCCGD